MSEKYNNLNMNHKMQGMKHFGPHVGCEQRHVFAMLLEF